MEKFLLDDILSAMLNSYAKGISDLNISVGRALQVEHDGDLSNVELEPELFFGEISPYQSFLLAHCLMQNEPRLLQDLIKNGSCDCAYSLRDEARFRVNIFSVRQNLSIVLRKLETEIPTLESLNSPDVFKDIATEKNGLVLVTGSTGSGKSTTLAAMLRSINEREKVHVVTLEDPIEFVHQNINSTFNQRELGVDFVDFSQGLRAALRQAPKVILVGELRDRATMEIALTAAETGHLVMSTLHTVDAGQTISRIVGMFEKEEEEQVRQRLGETLRWVVCQRLVKKQGGGKLAIHEIMGSNLRTHELILQGEDEVKSFYGVIDAASALGWKTFESGLVEAFEGNIISEETAMRNTTRRNIMRLKIDFIKNKRGQKTHDLNRLDLDQNYEAKTRLLK